VTFFFSEYWCKRCIRGFLGIDTLHKFTFYLLTCKSSNESNGHLIILSVCHTIIMFIVSITVPTYTLLVADIATEAKTAEGVLCRRRDGRVRKYAVFVVTLSSDF